MRRIFLVALGCAMIAGCSSTPKTDQAGAQVEERGAVEQPTVTPATQDKLAGTGLAALKDPKSILSRRTIYFDYDSFVVKDEFKPLVEAHARFLLGNPNMKMLIQGSADERGSREYNLALGQKRADAVRRALTLLGAKDSQIEAVSLGEESPKNPGHDEAAWAENRRGDMLYSGEF